MDLILGMAVSFLALAISVYKGIFLGYPLLLALLIFVFITWRKGFLFREILLMIYSGSKKAFIVLQILFLIGIVTAVWMSSGTVPAIVHYGIMFMHPHLFILYSFLITSLVSLLLGTSLGTVTTVGIALIMMAKSGGINTNIVAGAIIAGAYFGDRCSPMSSSAHLVATLTETDIYQNIKNMVLSAGVPFIISIIFYGLLSIYRPLNLRGNSIDTDILNVFNVSWIVLIPAIIILFMAVFKIDIKISMFVSIVAAFVISIVVQKYSVFEILNYLVWGFKLDEGSPLYNIIKGGGLISMGKAFSMVLIACSLAGIFEKTEMLKELGKLIKRANSRLKLLFSTTVIGTVTAVFGCSQTISIVLTNQLMKNTYAERKVDKYQLALDIENTSVVISALIPWSVAALVPTTTMSVSTTGFIPFAVYLYLIPLFNLLYLKLSSKNNS